MDRRRFVKKTALSIASAHVLPQFLARDLLAAVTGARGANGKALVVIFQRGAMDGLSLVAPTGDPYYSSLRPNIGISRSGEQPAIPLDDHFSLHPAFAPLKGAWDEGTLAFVHQAGSPDSTRSHFDAQDFMESGTPGLKSTEDGFLNRAMQKAPGEGDSHLRAVALQPNMPRILMGPFPAISMNSIREFDIVGGPRLEKEAQGFESMYQQAADRVFRGVGEDVFDALKTIKGARGDSAGAGELGPYPKTPLGKRLHDIGALIKANVGLQLAVTDIGGWDTHVNQGAHKGQLAGRLTELAGALAAFREDLGPLYSKVCVISMTEFGRTAQENGNRGTDHGHGSVMTLLGGGVRGRRIYGQWKELSPANLYEERDVPVTTDFRAVFGEVLERHLGLGALGSVFPGYPASRSAWIKFLA